MPAPYKTNASGSTWKSLLDSRDSQTPMWLEITGIYKEKSALTLVVSRGLTIKSQGSRKWKSDSWTRIGVLPQFPNH